ncbi:MAG: DUF937 domain-containing protein [Saprospiraceae bacterium]|jgi:hypothetical protein|nr:hypothetical protein [Saprospirales bacterium]
MSNLLDLIQSQLDDNLVGQLSNQLGVNDRQQASTAVNGVVSTLVSALAKNAATPERAAGLYNAIERDHDGSILDNLQDYLTGNLQPKPEQQRALNGQGILKHLLGDKQNDAASMLSQQTGLDSSKVMDLMSRMAPVVMGLLGKQKREQGLDMGGLAGLLTNTVSQQKSSGNSFIDMATSFLDKDGDGSALDDVAGMVGKGLFSRLFGRK